MIRLNLEPLSQGPQAPFFSASSWKSLQKSAPKLIKKLQQDELGFQTYLQDDSTPALVSECAGAIPLSSISSIVVLGIGGSSLSTTCFQNALTHLFGTQKNQPKCYVIDNIDPTLIADVEAVLDLKTTLFLVISKSGETMETISQFLYFKEKMEKEGLLIRDHFLLITDPQAGYLRELANKEQILSLSIPRNIGGRFSAFTAVGLLPAKLLGIDIDEIWQGAKAMRETSLNTDLDKNPALQLASIQYLAYKKKKTNHVLFAYSQKLQGFTNWYRQLLAESLGKRKNKKGKDVRIGITPIPALGVTDQHSQVQLYNEGPNDKLFLFFEIEEGLPSLQVPGINYPALSFLSHKTFTEMLKAEGEATKQALQAHGKPFISISLSRLDAFHMGELMQLSMDSVAFLGELFNINAFDQPGVELGKKLAKTLLEE